jgi:hypothetical protein
MVFGWRCSFLPVNRRWFKLCPSRIYHYSGLIIMAKKPPVTSANSRQERIKNRGKAPKSTPKGRQTTAMQRPFKPGTKTSNTTTKFAGQKALPAAGQSGGSQSPKGTTAPRRGGPVRTPAQLAQERRSAAASRKAGAGVGTRASNAAPTTAKGNKPNIVTKGLSKAGSPKGAGAGAVVEFINQLPEELRRARTGYYNLSKPNADRYNNLKNALGGVDPAKYFGTKLSGKGPTPAKPKAKPAGPALKGSMVNGKIQMTQVAKPKKPIAKPVAPKAATTPARSSALGRSSAPARTPTSRPAAKPAAKPKAPASMATESSMSASDIMKGYGMRVNQTFSAQSPSTPKKRESIKDQTASIKKMIEESKKRQGKG